MLEQRQHCTEDRRACVLQCRQKVVGGYQTSWREPATEREGGGRGGGNEVQVHVSANRLTMRDMGGTHITYLSFMLISIVFWLLGTETPQGRKLIVPFLHRQSSLLALQQSKVLHLP